jgi:hypothetical protein
MSFHKRFFLVLAVVPLVVFAQAGVKRLQYDNSNNPPMTSYKEWSAKIPKGPFAISSVRLDRSGNSRNPLVDLVVYAPLYPNIMDSMAVYVNDLVAEGYDVQVDTVRGWDVTALRSHLAALLDSELVGAVFIGNVPCAWYELESSEGREEFPIDLYLMDLNGTWADRDSDGIFDNHTGNKTPEIWVGRIYAGSMTWGNEIQLTNNYFSKIHKYRTGGYGIPQKALAYVDDDWYSFNNCNLNLLYDTVTVVRNYNTTTAADFRNRLDDPYEWVQVCSHSSPWGNTFKYTGGYAGSVFNFETWFADPPFLFLNLFQCSGTRFIEENAVGNCYIFGGTNGLMAVGSTKVGSMLNFDDFYGPLDGGISIGAAFQEWFAQWGITDPEWFYGMCILGDPTLKPKHPGRGTWNPTGHKRVFKTALNWTPPQPVDTDPETDGFPAVTKDGLGRIWAAWVTGRSVTNGRTEICAARYLNGAWSAAQIIDPFEYWDFSPTLTTDDHGRARLAWSRCYGRNYDIFASVYTGTAWGTPEHLSSKATNDMYPALTQDGDGRLWVALERWTHLNGDIYCRFNDGTTWQSTFAITTDSANDYKPAMATDSTGRAWVTWVSERWEYNRNIYVKSYDPTTGHWENLYRLTSNPNQDQDPKIAVDGSGTIWVVWMTWRNGNPDIYESHYDGASWSNARPVSTDSSRDEHPALVVDRDGFPWCVWQSDRSGDWEIYAKYYKNGAWRDSTLVSANAARDIFPVGTADDSGNVWILWQSNRSGNWNIYASRLFSDLVDPQVTVRVPNGGESWFISAIDTVRWSAVDNVGVDSVVVEYSTDNGSAWAYIASPPAQDSLYAWLIPATPSRECRVRVSAYDTHANMGADVSDDVFSIVDGEAPSVTVLSPNGGEVWFGGTMYPVKWTAQDNIGIDSLNIWLSFDGGASYPYLIAHINGNDSIFDWTVPDTVSNECLVRITGFDVSGNPATDVSDSLFAIGQFGVEDPAGQRPKSFAFFGVTPNPFQSRLTIRFQIPTKTLVRISVYDIEGKRVGPVMEKEMEPGVYASQWRSETLAAGVYLIKVQAGSLTIIRKAVLLR